MNKEKIQQERLCLDSKILVDLLRTKFFELDLPNKACYERDLKKLKASLNRYYWSI